MARPREFDPDAALEGALDIFWRQGFKATNLPELLSAMGLSRGSFYKAFSDKEHVYLMALDRYDTQVVGATVAHLAATNAPTAWEGLSFLFEAEDLGRRGCFICNAMVELAPDHPEVALKTARMAERLRAAIAAFLVRHGKRAEDATLVLHLYFGHQAVGKATHLPIDWTAQLRSALSPADADQPQA